MADDGVDQTLVCAAFLKQLRRFLAVLVRPVFKIDVVQKADNLPEIGFIAVSELRRHAAHDLRDGDRMNEVEGLLVVAAQQRHRLFVIHIHRSL